MLAPSQELRTAASEGGLTQARSAALIEPVTQNIADAMGLKEAAGAIDCPTGGQWPGNHNRHQERRAMTPCESDS